MNIQQVLQNFGLSDAEAKLYIAGLEIGEAPLSVLAKKAGVKRGSAYMVAGNLERKGLMGSYKMRGGMRFVSASPVTLDALAKKNASDIATVLPTLKAMELGDSEKPNITMYTGREGFLTVFEDSLAVPGDTIRAIGSLEKFYETITYEYDDEYYIPERVRRNISFKGLYFADEVEDKFPIERNRKELREARYLPKKFFQPCFTFIYRNTVVIFSSQKELVAVKIVSEDIATSEKSKFDLIWELVRE